VNRDAARDSARDYLPGRRRSAWTLALGAGLALAFAGFVALGVWQLQRMAWKQALIARVDARVAAEPVAPPSRGAWPTVGEDSHAYLRVRLDGEFLPVPGTRTQAVTALGGGAWLLAPLRTVDGDIVLVNRGFVPAGERAAPPPAGVVVSVVGLLRTSEPDGGFLRDNDPAGGRWYSRDVAAIARASDLPADAVAPFFVDAFSVKGADAAALNGDAAWPRAGMTVIRFRDPHLTYALTWFGMALLTAFAVSRLVVSGRRLRQDRGCRGGFHHAGAVPHR
jgi:surfeit locus 1 family protein